MFSRLTDTLCARAQSHGDGHGFTRFFAILLALLPLIGFFAPRLYGFLPLMLGATGFAGLRAESGQWPRLSAGVFAWALFIIFFVFAGSLYAPDRGESLHQALKTVPVVLGGALFISVCKALDLRAQPRFVQFFTAIVLLTAALCLLELFFNAPLSSLTREVSERLKSRDFSFLNRGILTLVFFSIMTFFTLNARTACDSLFYKYRRWALLPLALILAGILSRTDSQAAQMALAVAGLTYLIFPVARPKAWLLLAFLVSGLIFAAPFIVPPLFAQFAQFANGMPWLKSAYAANRLEIWDFISQKALESPLWGHGFEATQYIHDFKNKMLFHRSTSVLHPHNFALQLWIEYGLLGAMAGSVLITNMLMRMRAAPAYSACFMLCLFMAVLATAATTYGLWQAWWLGLFSILIGYALMLEKFWGDKEDTRTP